MNKNFHKRLMQVKIGGGNEVTVFDDNIRLADVLLAIDKTNLTKLKQFKDEKWTMPEFAGYVVLKLIDIYNLEDDNLDNQSDELKEFLFNLLVKKI